ncbi:MAG TPA: tetratricopeptide repeat protein, partial [Thermoanaerobaculia bacterium]|nr:tetratricopeptide repeat protein [Thermoanaerobaculia bacterium]
MSDPQSSQELTELTALARRFSQREMYEEAADLFLLALRLDPKNLGVKLGLAEVRKLQRQQKGGPPRTLKEMLREQFRRDAIDAAHFMGLAHLYAEKGENGRAIECIEVAKAKDMENPGHHKLHGRILFRRQEYDTAAEELARALRLNPFDRETAESLGRAEYERKQFEPALGAAVHAFLLLNEADKEGI